MRETIQLIGNAERERSALITSVQKLRKEAGIIPENNFPPVKNFEKQIQERLSQDGKTSLCLFFHANPLYAEIDEELIPKVFDTSYLPLLNLLSRHPEVRSVLEFPGYLLDMEDPSLHGRLEQFKEMAGELAANGNVEFVASTYADSLGPITPLEFEARQIVGFEKRFHEEIGQKSGVKPRGIYPQEFWVTPEMVELLDVMGYEYYTSWTDHLATDISGIKRTDFRKAGQVDTRKSEDLQRYLEGDFIHPYQGMGKNRAVIDCLPINGDSIFRMIKASNNEIPMDDYIAEQERIHLNSDPQGKGIFIPGHSDLEFFGYHPFESRPPITTEWLNAYLNRIKKNNNFTFCLPSVHFSIYPPERSLRLNSGGDTQDLAPWTKDPKNQLLNYKTQSTEKLYLAEYERILSLETQGYDMSKEKKLLLQAERNILLSQNSDHRGFGPTTKRRRNGFNQERRARRILESISKAAGNKDDIFVANISD